MTYSGVTMKCMSYYCDTASKNERQMKTKCIWIVTPLDPAKAAGWSSFWEQRGLSSVSFRFAWHQFIASSITFCNYLFLFLYWPPLHTERLPHHPHIHLLILILVLPGMFMFIRGLAEVDLSFGHFAHLTFLPLIFTCGSISRMLRICHHWLPLSWYLLGWQELQQLQLLSSCLTTCGLKLNANMISSGPLMVSSMNIWKTQVTKTCSYTVLKGV